jgi:hypothetical protein
VPRWLAGLLSTEQLVCRANEGWQLFLSQDEKTVSELNATVHFPHLHLQWQKEASISEVHSVC